jgi:hypothetical protein
MKLMEQKVLNGILGTSSSFLLGQRKTVETRFEDGRFEGPFRMHAAF